MAQARPGLRPSPALGTQVHVAQASPYIPKFQSPQPLVREAQARLEGYNTLDTIHLSNLTYPGSVGNGGQLGSLGWQGALDGVWLGSPYGLVALADWG